MENVRRRMQKQIDDQKLFGIQGFCKDLLEVADILGTATDAVPKEALKENKHLSSLYDGLLMTNTHLTKVFTKHGLIQIIPNEGDKFDPNIHEALFQQERVSGKEPGTIGTITKTGYKLHERTLRPTLVGVFK